MEFLLKSSLLIIIFYIVYRLFLQKDTFYTSFRIYFWFAIIISIVLPFVYFPVYVSVQEQTTIDMIASNTDGIYLQENSFSWSSIFYIIYFIGLIFFGIKFIIELISIRSLFNKNETVIIEGAPVVVIEEEGQAFSFWNRIFVHISSFTEEELKLIVLHEKIHIQKLHTIDVVLSRILLIILWFNPFAWLFQKAMHLNLEYQTDQLVNRQINSVKEYQYLLLKTGLSKYQFALANSFNYSPLKNRIMMLQKEKSKRIKQLKYLLVIPFLALFIYSFGMKPVIRHSDNILMSKDSVKTTTGHIKYDKKNYFYMVNKFENNHYRIAIYNRYGDEITDPKIKHELMVKIKTKLGIASDVVIIKEDAKNSIFVYNGKKKDAKKPIFVFNGKMISEREMRKVDRNSIKRIIVLKGEKAFKKYGKKGKNGVVEIYTK